MTLRRKPWVYFKVSVYENFSLEKPQTYSNGPHPWPTNSGSFRSVVAIVDKHAALSVRFTRKSPRKTKSFGNDRKLGHFVCVLTHTIATREHYCLRWAMNKWLVYFEILNRKNLNVEIYLNKRPEIPWHISRGFRSISLGCPRPQKGLYPCICTE